MGDNSGQSYCREIIDSSTSPNITVNLIWQYQGIQLIADTLPRAPDESATGKNNAENNLMYVNVI